MANINTNDSGIPKPSNDQSVTAGINGPLVLHDHVLTEKLAHFNRERIPERVVHAKGAGAFGYFKVTNDISAYTKAKFLQPNKQTEILIRFSEVAAEQGAPDTWRDVRGFAVRFYTEQGNYDLVGNNTPVFFVRDPMLFTDFIRSQKRLPDTGLRDKNMQWDFWTLRPETAHQVAILMSDRGIPKTYRHMHGFGSHTYQWTNAKAERFWIKYHLTTQQGIANLTEEQANEIAGNVPDYHRKDLYDAIDRGEYPSWILSVQIMPIEEAKNYKFNPFDLTKVWPHSDYPLQQVGILTLNKKPENFFAEIEQAAFSPANIVPGIGFSPDKMLLARAFAYDDAHRYRVGVNYKQLPVNKPKTAVNSYSRDGAMSYNIPSPNVPVYAPNSYNGSIPDPEISGDDGVWDFTVMLGRSAYAQHAEDDDFIQAHNLVRNVFNDSQRESLFQNIIASTAEVSQKVLLRVVEYWRKIDNEIGEKLASHYQIF